MKRVLVADDHEVTRRGVVELVELALGEVDVTEVGDGHRAMAELEAGPWDLALFDVLMDGPGVVALVEAFRSHREPVPVLVLTGLTEIELVVAALAAGANGYIHKHRSADELEAAITMVAAGGRYLHSETAIEVAEAMASRGVTKPHEHLSPRELQIFRQLALGMAVKEVAAELGLSDKTVATYLARIRSKTGLQSLVDIARYAMREGLVE